MYYRAGRGENSISQEPKEQSTDRGIRVSEYLVGQLVLGAQVSPCGLAVRLLAGKQKDLGSIRFGSPFSSIQKLWFMGTVS